MPVKKPMNVEISVPVNGMDNTVPRFVGTKGNLIEKTRVLIDDHNIFRFTNAPIYDDLQGGISNVRVPTSNYPTERLYDGGTGGVTFPFLGFALNNYLYFDVQTSHSMQLNTILQNHIHFTLPNVTDIGDKFQFQLDVMVAGINGEWEVPTGSPFTGEHTIVAGDNTYHRVLEIAEIPASNPTLSTIYKCKFTRIAASSDEYGSEVYITYIDCHYMKDSIGSRLETSK